jgi:hypothetical protein
MAHCPADGDDEDDSSHDDEEEGHDSKTDEHASIQTHASSNNSVIFAHSASAA